MRTSIGGTQVRIRLSQAFGAPAVTVGAAHIALRSTGAGIAAGTDRPLTFSGQPSAVIYAGQTVVSDPVALRVPPLSDVAVSLFFPGETGPPTSHTFGLRPTYVANEGDATAAADWPMSPRRRSYYWLTGVDVMAPADAFALITFGDSITDGDQSTPTPTGCGRRCSRRDCRRPGRRPRLAWSTPASPEPGARRQHERSRPSRRATCSLFQESGG